MRHAEIEELLGAFALDAVDGAERAFIEAHLHECPRCRAEVTDYRESAAMLAHVGAAAPDGLWDRIVGSLEEAPPSLELARVVPLRPPQRRVAMSLLAGVAAVAAAVISVLGIRVVQQDRRIDELALSVAQGGFDQQVAALAVDPAALKVHLVSADGAQKAEAVLSGDGRGYLVNHNLPPLGADRTYQLWAQIGDQKVSLGLLGAQPGKAAFQVRAPVAALAVTEEVANGVERSENPAVVSGWVPGNKVGRA